YRVPDGPYRRDRHPAGGSRLRRGGVSASGQPLPKHRHRPRSARARSVSQPPVDLPGTGRDGALQAGAAVRRAVPLGQPRADSAGRPGDRIGRVAHAVAVPVLLVRASPGARAPESGKSRWGLNRPTGPLGAKELEHGQQLAVGAGILLEGVRRGLPRPWVPILTAVAVKTPSVQGISKKTIVLGLFLTVYSGIFLQNRELRDHTGGVAPGPVSPQGADGSTC